MGFPVPQGTLSCFGQDIDGGIFIAVEHQPTGGTHMCASGERFLDTLSTARAILTGVGWGHGDDWHIVHDTISFDPSEELAPGRIMDTLGKLMVLDQVADLKEFVGNQVVRRDERVRRFTSEIFTLPLHFQIRFSQALSSFLAILSLFLFTRHAPMETFQFCLRLAIVTWVLNLLAV